MVVKNVGTTTVLLAPGVGTVPFTTEMEKTGRGHMISNCRCVKISLYTIVRADWYILSSTT